ncbi:unnamed protein product [Mytilus coruscus]|uniref:DUF1758 domain-containing protein n=1 Tax=Mytilus coruscus TaxID=42192 RepID=A0A6J8BC67_MYTCO|nr:unnamed protein product [Mytilus coruscus]
MYELDCKLRHIRKFIKSIETNTRTSHDNVDHSTSRLNANAYYFTPEARVDLNTCATDSINQQYSNHASAVHTNPPENIMVSPNGCKKCNGMHHTSICKRKEVITDTSQEPKIQQSAINVIETTDKTSVMYSSQQSNDILLKTATAPVIFDEGAQRSFITQKLANKQEIKPTGKVSIYLSALGNLSQNVCNLDTVTIQLQTNTGEKVCINTFIVPQIAVPIQNKISHTTRSLPNLRRLKLAHSAIVSKSTY